MQYLKRPSLFPPEGLMARFLLMAGGVLIVGMLVIGFWVTSKIEEGVTNSAGVITALYVDAVLSPVVQELALGDQLSPRNLEALERVLRRGALRDQISVFKLWTPGGKVAYSDNPALMGRVLGSSPGLEDALSGSVHTRFDRTFHTENVGAAGVPLLEVYSPVRSVVDGQIIGVAEFYTTAQGLAGDLAAARIQSWVVVGLVSLAMSLALSLVVAGGSRTIKRQRRSLDAQLAELSVLAQNNAGLAQRVEQANHRIASLNEDNLRRISADLHDGPVQQLAFAALRLGKSENERQQQVRRAIDEAMQEIRDICSGLALPDLDDWSVTIIAKRLAAAQGARTGSKVALDIPSDLPTMTPAAKICIYRFLQEALNNCAKHAPGAEQRVSIEAKADILGVSVSDDGPGFDRHNLGDGLGLVGLRERIAGLKGHLRIDTEHGAGTTLSMHLPILAEGQMT
ncbi:MAG: hypothetical protein ABS76_07990 [Pelagibacterium sp. SCN 64-44]|nr:MAG: hypothetical protein ABS76_07990 [Pelagibacterium sp. SCN 64-44]